MSSVRWVGSWSQEGRLDVRVGRDGDELVAEWVGFATLRATRFGEGFTFSPVAGADPVFVEKFHRGIVRALIRHLDGGLTLHASAFARRGMALACFGASGDGKSTTVAALCTRSDVELVSDDTAPISFASSDVRVAPSESIVWLPPDAVGHLGGSAAWIAGRSPDSVRKTPTHASLVAGEPVRLGALVRLSFDDTAGSPVLRRLEGCAAFKAVSLAAIRFVLDEPDVLARDFHQLATLSERVPVFELTRARDLTQLARSVDALLTLHDQIQQEAHDARRP